MGSGTGEGTKGVQNQDQVSSLDISCQGEVVLLAELG